MTAPAQSTGYTVAILGATGLVGTQLMQILEERQFPVKTLKPLASQRTAGTTVTFQGQDWLVEEATPEAFEGVDIVLASAGGSVSQALVPEAVKRGCVVIDNTSCFRLTEGVPLVVAGVNDADIEHHQGIIANPNCSTAQLMPVFKALDDAFGLERVIVSTYQSVSGAGKEGMDELLNTTRSVFKMMGESEIPAPTETEFKVFARPIAFNLVAQIDQFVEGGVEDGYTKEETKVIHESRKILHKPDLKVTCTAVRVPVMVGHSESVTLEFKKPVSPDAAMAILEGTPDVVVARDPKAFPTPVEATGQDPVYVGRIRRDTSNPENGLNLWIVADNLRIGAALNAVRLAEVLVKHNWLKPRQPAGV
ncbi:aspartate-semialdehyde dehydrogenase [Vampirovibrio chlorellavorus]|uniref:aspartate-semialdehyde dehydrogenase n=1 Tax=Vampirovibrio chlorellavorus TaxID=758823 RepID=UPI0026EDAB92|nr:aspartate-semialdehyde dehydrogenase [Vampirovibrio chlorellavorus]